MPGLVSRYLVAYIGVGNPVPREGRKEPFEFEIQEQESLAADTCEFLVLRFDIIADELLKELREDRLRVIGQDVQWQRALIVYHELALSEDRKTRLQRFASDKGISLTLMGPTRKEETPIP